MRRATCTCTRSEAVGSALNVTTGFGHSAFNIYPASVEFQLTGSASWAITIVSANLIIWILLEITVSNGKRMAARSEPEQLTRPWSLMSCQI